MDDVFRSRVPWSSEPSLEEKTRDVGINFDMLIQGIAKNRTDVEMAEEFGVSPAMISYLRDHFFRLGLQSIIGQD